MRTMSHNSVLIWTSKEESDRARHFHVFCGEIEVCIYEKMKKVFSWVNFLVRLSSTTKSKSQMNNQLEIGCLSNDHAVRGMSLVYSREYIERVLSKSNGLVELCKCGCWMDQLSTGDFSGIGFLIISSPFISFLNKTKIKHCLNLNFNVPPPPAPTKGEEEEDDDIGGGCTNDQ